MMFLLHRCIQTAVQNHLSRAMNHSFSFFAIQKAILRHSKRLANERRHPVLVSNAIQVREIQRNSLLYSIRFQFRAPEKPTVLREWSVVTLVR